MNEMVIGMIIGFVAILLTVGVVTYVICSIKAISVLNRMMNLYEPMFNKLKDYVDDM